MHTKFLSGGSAFLQIVIKKVMFVLRNVVQLKILGENSSLPPPSPMQNN